MAIGFKGWSRGDICVIREINGRECVLRLSNQSSYKEWTGCFSII